MSTQKKRAAGGGKGGRVVMSTRSAADPELMRKARRHARTLAAAATPSEAAAEVPTDRADLGRQFGRSGTKAYSGYINEDFNPEFNGRQAIAVCDQMRRTDGTVAAVLRALKWPLMASEWVVESADSADDLENEIAEFVRANLFDRMGEGGFQQFLRESLGYLDFGFWYFEKVWEVEGANVWLKKLASLHPTAHEKWAMADGTPGGIMQFLPSREKGDDTKYNPSVPFSKLVLFTNEREGDNYAGTPILRGAFKHFFMKDQLYRIDAITHERGAGLLKIRHPNDDASKAVANDLGQNFAVNEQMYVALPGATPAPGTPGWDAELMTAGIGDQASARLESIKHHDRMISQSILAQFMDIGAGSHGNASAVESQQSFFGYALKAVADYWASVVNEHLVKEMVRLNFGEREAFPRLRCPRAGAIDQPTLATTLKTLKDGGMLSLDPEFMVWITKAFGLPERTVEDFQAMLDAAKPMPADPNADPGGEPAALSARRRLGSARFDRGPNDRPLTPAEGRVQFAAINKAVDDAEGKVKKDLQELSDAQLKKLRSKAEAIIDSDDVGSVSGLDVTGNAAIEGRLLDEAKANLDKGAGMAAGEIGVAAASGASVAYAKKVLAAQVAQFVKDRANTITGAVRKRLLDILNGDIGKAAGRFEIEKVIAEANDMANQRILGKIVMGPINEGRWLTFDDAKDQIWAIQRSEVLDDVTCPTCISLDGKVLSQSDPFASLGEVHDHCRGMNVAILKTDADLPEPKPLPKYITSRFDTVGGVPSTNEYRAMPSAVVTKDSRAARKVKDGELEI